MGAAPNNLTARIYFFGQSGQFQSLGNLHGHDRKTNQIAFRNLCFKNFQKIFLPDAIDYFYRHAVKIKISRDA